MNKTCHVLSCNNNGTRDEWDGTASFTPRYHTCTVSDERYCNCIHLTFDIPLEIVRGSKERTIDE